MNDKSPLTSKSAKACGRRIRKRYKYSLGLTVLATVAFWVLTRPTVSYFVETHPQYVQLVEILALFVGIVGLFIALWHLDKLSLVEKNLQDVADDISTYSVGPFPQHLGKIAELVSEAEVNEQVDILADCIDYGSFFAPLQHKQIIDSLMMARQKHVNVRVLVCGPPQAITYGSSYRDGAHWDTPEFLEFHKRYVEAIRADNEFVEWLGKICKREPDKLDAMKFVQKLTRKRNQQVVKLSEREFEAHLQICCKECGRNKAWPLDKEVFVTLLMLRQKWFENYLSAPGTGITVDYLEGEGNKPPIFFWVRRYARKAIFAIADPGHEWGHGFQTHDSDLLAIFESIFQEKFAQAIRQKKATEAKGTS